MSPQPTPTAENTLMPIDLPAPRVSVVIPTFNRPVLIKRALWSVFEQTFDDFEVLLVDDGSTDETPEVLAAFRDVRLRTVGLEQNQGGARARNVGIERARGEWVAFLDSDDTWLPEKLERQLALADSDRTASVFYCSCYRDDPKRGRYIQTDQDIPNGDPLEGLLRDRRPKTTSVFLVKRDVLRQLGGFDEAFPSSQDIDLWLRLARAGNRFRGLNDPLAVKYNHQGDQISSDPIALVRGFHMMDKRWGGSCGSAQAGGRTTAGSDGACFGLRRPMCVTSHYSCVGGSCAQADDTCSR